jgi:predicted phosphodiesterase
MRLLLLSDIHANLEALHACLEAAPDHDGVVNLGDVVGYNASPNEVCEVVQKLGGTVVRGNHDRACSGLSDLSEFNLIAAMSARWTQMMIEPEHRMWLRELPQGPVRFDELPGVEFVHGSPRDEDEYVLSAPTAALDFHLSGHRDIIFFGHTHLQGGFIFNSGRTQPFTPVYEGGGSGKVSWTMPLEAGERYLINPGSVGQPRDNDWRAAFALYNSEAGGEPGAVTFFRVPYDVQQTQERVLAANLPERLATRLALGR